MEKRACVHETDACWKDGERQGSNKPENCGGGGTLDLQRALERGKASYLQWKQKGRGTGCRQREATGQRQQILLVVGSVQDKIDTDCGRIQRSI